MHLTQNAKAAFHGSRAAKYEAKAPTTKAHGPTYDVSVAYGQRSHASFQAHTERGRKYLRLWNAERGLDHFTAALVIDSLMANGLRVKIAGSPRLPHFVERKEAA